MIYERNKMMKSIILTVIVASFLSCNKAKESAQDALTNSMEKAIENKTGTQVDLPDAADMENNAGFINYKVADKVYLKTGEKMQATAVFNKDNNGLSIALQLVGENGKSFMATASHLPENFSLPLKAKFSVSNTYDGSNPSAMLLFMNVNQSGLMAAEIPYEGELIITQLSAKNIEFTIDGKGGDASDAESPSNWKPISGDGKLSHPIIMSYGIDKNKVLK